ncbi:hypothetical protein [Foetidibacter luteolus]|uniref:hypothetical protein n=1 Tax=Foetidibacter luteolus TaxID=2608880 RepID=UPI00129B6E7D|nr:hypothetical protein [Foetidibacter luteolus]
MAKKNNGSADLTDSRKDQEKMQPETATIDLPEVKDIPGQEHVHPPALNEYRDTTISSADEEGYRVFGDDSGDEGDVTEEEKELLEQSEQSTGTEDDESVRRVILDNKDDDGTALNEYAEVSGEDLDIPGAEDDDDNEDIGEEDEENNSYSLGGDRHD